MSGAAVFRQQGTDRLARVAKGRVYLHEADGDLYGEQPAEQWMKEHARAGWVPLLESKAREVSERLELRSLYP